MHSKLDPGKALMNIKSLIDLAVVRGLFRDLDAVSEMAASFDLIKDVFRGSGITMPYPYPEEKTSGT